MSEMKLLLLERQGKFLRFVRQCKNSTRRRLVPRVSLQREIFT